MSDETSWLRAIWHCEYRQHSDYEWHRAEYTYQCDCSVSMSDKQQNTRSRTQEVEYKKQNTRSKTQEAECKKQNIRSKT